MAAIPADVYLISGIPGAGKTTVPEPRPGLWLDTSDLDVARTVQAILDRAGEAMIN